MNFEIPRHEKIRFRRHEVCDLERMPSAVASVRPGLFRSFPRRTLRIAMLSAASLAALAFVAVAAVLIIGMSGWGSDSLRREAERAIEAAAGFDVSSTIGATRLTFDGSRFLALELADVDVTNAATSAPILKAGAMRFGIRLFPLLTGRLQLGSASISDARLDFGQIPFAGKSDWTAVLRNDRGLLDPDRIAPLLFGQIASAMDLIGAGGTRGLDLSNVVFVGPVNGKTHELTVQSGTIARSSPGVLSVEIAADVTGRAVTIEGSATRDDATRRIESLELAINGQALEDQDQDKPVKSMNQLGGFSVAVSGHDAVGADPARLKLEASLEKSSIDFGARGVIEGNVDLGVTLLSGSGKVEIDRLKVDVGRNSLEFNGALGPKPASEGVTEPPAYRFELVSTRTIAAPEESPERPLDFGMKVSGAFDPATRVLSADEIAIRNDSGDAMGTARVSLVDGSAPGIEMALDVRGMQVAHFKQLWPFFAGPKARLWVYNHVFGGTVRKSRIEMKVQPGRIGDGVPLSNEEIYARFEIDDTRFDTAGLIPPVRDASGVVEVRGNDVDLSIVSGVSYLPSGRQVQASNATMAVRSFNVQPVIGKLEMDVAGSADAVAELATYEPINVLGRVGLKPEELTGTVSGHVTADIPLQKGVDPKTLDWLVTLDFKGLSVSRPFEGQLLTDADGSITVDPAKASLSADGKLNGMPAELALVEPLREGAERERNVKLVLNDQARDAIAPGLAGIVTGPVEVQLEGQASSRTIVADLERARIDLPWVGWTKGAGVAATAKFTAKTGQDTVTLSDFTLTGATFSASGSFAINGGKLSSARLDSLKLNRGDDVAVTVKRTAKGGYGVDVSGKSLDARALIKRITGNGSGKSGAREKAGDEAEASVALNLRVDRLGGFNDESLSGVVLAYDGAGSAVRGLSLSASTASGSPISVGTGEGGAKGLQLTSEDAGSVLRFLDLYEHMQGGSIKVALAGPISGEMSGQIDARDFWIINEPKLASIVSTTPAGSNRNLSQAVRKDIDTSRVKFERGFAQIRKGPGILEIANGVLRGPLIGTTFQGTLYDPAGKMDMTGTFMPAYGLNRIFGELPLVGAILGNGRDRGLIGVTYRLRGDAKSPRLDINPLSVIAPGIFRSIFEFQ